MATRRTYGDGCAIAHGLDLVGERWALLVVRELLLGPKRFTDLKNGLPNASPNVISERLRELERAGVVARDKLPPPAGSRVYRLTDWGRELEDIVMSLGRWAARSPSRPAKAPIGPDSLVLALRARFDADAAKGLRASYELRLGEDRFRIALSGDQIELARGGADQPDATIDTDADTLAAVLWDGRPLADAQHAGAIAIEGDKAAVRRLLRLFPLPEPAAA
jgi:DNA-binding HxlR family transcriptional regulator/putative sterol carrier protein